MSTPIRSQSPGRPKDPEKRAAILDAAKELFSEKGYAGTSMDAVANAAGVSKLTVYSHYGDKDGLFREAVRARCEEVVPETLYRLQPGAGLRESMLVIARHHARLMTSPEVIGVWRAICGDSREGSPRLGRLLWEEGPQRTLKLMEQFLAAQVAAGALDIDDVTRAAGQFMALLKGDLHFRRMLGCVQDDCSEFADEVVSNAESAVDMFLRAYAPR